MVNEEDDMCITYVTNARSDIEEGGETVFPDSRANISAVPWWNELSECAKKGLSLKPKRGDALLFWSMRPDTTLDPSSLHGSSNVLRSKDGLYSYLLYMSGSCPVIRGSKWSCTKWMHIGEYKV
ncbi:hypothetical protein ACFE04_011869 [Oxalis oulophora]